MTVEGAALASVRFVGVGPESHCGGGHDRSGIICGRCLLGRHGLRHPLWWRARQLRALLSPLFARSAWVQTATVVVGKTDQGAAPASVRLVGVGPASHCGGGHGSSGRRSGLFSLGRHGLRQPLWWRTRQVKALLRPLFGRSAWAQPASVVTGMSNQVAALSSVRLVGKDSHCGGRQHRSWRCLTSV
jgi:hypothetical protein